MTNEPITISADRVRMALAYCFVFIGGGMAMIFDMAVTGRQFPVGIFTTVDVFGVPITTTEGMIVAFPMLVVAVTAIVYEMPIPEIHITPEE